MTTYTCHCGKAFTSPLSLNAHKSHHVKRAPSFSSRVCVIATREEIASYNLEHYISNMSQCLHCSKFIQRKKFCSSSCSASFNNSGRLHSKETKDKISSSVSSSRTGKSINASNKYDGPYSRLYFLSCTCCSKPFTYGNAYKRTCSPECARKNQTYRKIVHEYDNNGVTVLLESSWEVDIATWLGQQHLLWIRPKHLKWIDSTGKNRLYFPDFYIPQLDLYLDPKNDYQMELGKEKMTYIQTKYNIIYGKVDDIKSAINLLIASGGGSRT